MTGLFPALSEILSAAHRCPGGVFTLSDFHLNALED